MSSYRENRRRILLFVFLISLPSIVRGQSSSSSPDTPAVAELNQRLDRLYQAVEAVHLQIDESQRQMQDLSSQIRQIQSELAGRSNLQPRQSPESEPQSADVANLSAAVDSLQDQSETQQAEIKQHDQSKVESASKYPIKVTGQLLFSSFLTDGVVDNIDAPVFALPRTPYNTHGSLAASLRQTTLGLDATGPHIGGARSSGDFSVDFFGDLSYSGYSNNLGALRLRTAHISLSGPGISC